MTASAPFLSADKRATYVTMSNGMRRRVELVDGKFEFMRRRSKAERKAEKRARHRP